VIVDSLSLDISIILYYDMFASYVSAQSVKLIVPGFVSDL